MSSTTKHPIQYVPRGTPPAQVIDIMHQDGCLVVTGFLSNDQIDRIVEDMAPSMKALKPGSAYDDKFLKDFHGDSTKRLTNLVQRSKSFREEVFDDDYIHSINEEVFTKESGSYWMTTTQVIDIAPGEKRQYLHRDLENYLPMVMLGPKGPEAMVNYLIALTDFTDQNGATRLIPGSHLWPDFKENGRQEDTIPALMKKGDMLVLSGKTSHSGGANNSDHNRCGIAFSFNASYLTPEEAYPFCVDMEIAKNLSPRGQKMIGYRSQYPIGSPGLWQLDYKDIGEHIGLEPLK